MDTLKELENQKSDAEKEQGKMYGMQADIMSDICSRIRIKIPNFIAMIGITISLAVVLDDKEKANTSLLYSKQFIRMDFLTKNREECYDNLHKFVSPAFESDSLWQLKTLDNLESEFFNAMDKK